MSQLEIKNLTYVYSAGTPYEKIALNNVSLNIEKGDFIGLIGTTGSGKSTFVRQLNALLKPTKGQVFFNGRDIWQWCGGCSGDNREKEPPREILEAVLYVVYSVSKQAVKLSCGGGYACLLSAHWSASVRATPAVRCARWRAGRSRPHSVRSAGSPVADRQTCPSR